MPHEPGHYTHVTPPGQPQQTFEPGMLYPLEDPGAAVRNTLRKMGILGSPFSPANQRWQQRLISSVLPSFLMQAQGMGDVKDIGTTFSDFIQSFVQGGNRLSMSGATQGLGSIRDLLSQTSRAISESPLSKGLDLSDPEVRKMVAAQMLGKDGQVGQLSPLQYGIAGMTADPEAQMKMMLGAYLPSMGGALTQGLGKSMAPLQQGYEDYLDTISNVGTGDFVSLLDMILGKTSSGGGMGSPTPSGGVSSIAQPSAQNSVGMAYEPARPDEIAMSNTGYEPARWDESQLTSMTRPVDLSMVLADLLEKTKRGISVTWGDAIAALQASPGRGRMNPSTYSDGY